MLTHQSLQARLWLLGLTCALGVAVLALSSIWHAYHSKEILQNFVDERIALNRAATGAYAHGLQMGQALRNILLDPANKKAYDNFAAANTAFKEETDKLASLLARSADGGALADKLKGNIGQWQPFQKQIIDLVKDGKGSDAQSLLVAKETPTWRAVRADLLELVKRSEAEAEQDRVKLMNGLDSSRSVAIVLGLFGFVLVAGVTFLVARGILQQIGGEPADAAAMLQRIAAGDLSQAVVVRPGDTTSIVAVVGDMQAQIRQLIGGTVASADTVVRESEAMRGDADRLSHTAQEQSAAATAIATAVEQLTAGIGIMSDSANAAGRLSAQSEQKANASLGIVATATDTIQQVADGVANASVTMEELSQKVGSIDGIVQTIREIADQTNLLALNAAIEAARAGEQGRGFAVVADEVRKLAERTTASTQEISAIVGGVRQTTDAAQETMGRAKGLALSGATHTEEVRNAVMELDRAAADVSQAIASIASALREQTVASTNIAQRVDLIARGIEQTHAASSASSSRSGELVDLSHALKENVRRFRI